MSHKTGYTHTLNKQSREIDRTQLDRLRRTSAQQALGDEDWLEESERYLDNVKATQSLYRKRSQFGGMGEETGE
jgi:hypothetical protein